VDTHVIVHIIQNLEAIYRHYDPQNSGKIDYRAFIEKLLFSSTS